MKNRTNVTPWVIFGALCAGAFCAPWILPWAEAQRTGYVEKQKVSTGTATGNSAFANQLAPNPAAGLVLTPVGTDTSKVQWGTSGSSLPAGTPGQVPTVSAITATGTVTTTATQTTTGTATSGTYSFTATGTVTTTGTEIKMTNGTVDFDPMGTFYLGSLGGESEGPIWARRNDLSNIYAGNTTSYSATCSTGSDALLASFLSTYMVNNITSWPRENLALIPGGQWMSDIKAKVSANGAAIRIEVWAGHDFSNANEENFHLFNWTTDAFTNTGYAQIRKNTTAIETTLPQGTSVDWSLYIKLYATCSTSTTVTMETSREDNGFASRIYSPFTVEKVSASQIYYYGEYGYSVESELWGAQNWRTTVNESLAGKETAISGTPGQFVKFIGTGTSATTSKGGVTVSIPTPITTRTITIPAGDFTTGVGASAGNVGSAIYTWALRDGQGDSVYGAVLHVPAEYVSGMVASVVWSPSATDSTSTHLVRWNLGYQDLATGNPTWASSASWSGTTCGTSCTANYLKKETATGSITVTAGSPYALYFTRDGLSGLDTYVGDVRLVALIFSYTSSL